MKTESVTFSKSAIVTAKTNLKEKEKKLFTWVKAKKAMILSSYLPPLLFNSSP